MLFIITGHLLGDNGGDLLGKQTPYSITWFVLWGVEAFCVLGTNCFFLISGYFLIEHKFTWKKVLILCIETWFYSATIYGFCLASGISHFDKLSLFQAFTPILGRTWWFVSTYIGMYILSPFLNSYLRSIDETTHKKLIMICLCLFSLIPTFYPFADTFSAGGGGGIVWFFTLYVIASYIRLQSRSIHVKTTILLSIFFSSVGLMIISKYLITFVTDSFIGNPIGTSVFYSNCSILNVVASICLFLCFVQAKQKSFPDPIKRIVLWTGRVSFGVYIIHNNPWLSPSIWEIIIDWFYSEQLYIQMLMVLLVPIAIYFACGIIDTIRKKLFTLIKLT